MSVVETEAKLRGIAATTLGVPIETVEAYARIDEDSHFDSMKLLLYILAVETAFGITLGEKELQASIALAYRPLAAAIGARFGTCPPAGGAPDAGSGER
nr:hypothetical protein [uncultured Rhodopila sp.]